MQAGVSENKEMRKTTLYRAGALTLVECSTTGCKEVHHSRQGTTANRSHGLCTAEHPLETLVNIIHLQRTVTQLKQQQQQ